MKKTILSLSLVIPGLSAIAQHDHAMHQKDHENKANDENLVKFENSLFSTSYGHYIKLKNSLVTSDQQAVSRAANALQNTAKELEGGTEIVKKAAVIANASSLNDQRIAFTELSNEMTTLLKNNELSSGTIYLEYCPMAKGNQGGYWLSNEKEIQNPYFGDKMLKCGIVQKVIE